MKIQKKTYDDFGGVSGSSASPINNNEIEQCTRTIGNCILHLSTCSCKEQKQQKGNTVLAFCFCMAVFDDNQHQKQCEK